MSSLKLTSEQQSQPQVCVLVASGLIYVMDNNKITYVMEDSNKNKCNETIDGIHKLCVHPPPPFPP